jgi:hypothetical protein
MAIIYYDLGSPYAYLSVQRAASVLAAPPRLQPVLAGAIFDHRGRGSWAHTGARPAADRLAAGLAAQHAPGDARRDLGRRAVRARRVPGGLRGRRRPRRARGPPGDRGARGPRRRRAPAAIADPAVKAALRTATDQAIALGVRGVPTLATDDGRLLFGDDRLEEALRARATPAARRRSRPARS